jgi:hypothetical protein
MKESSTREASKVRRIEELDGGTTERGNEKDINDVDPVGN